jgi:hypothetical protein
MECIFEAEIVNPYISQVFYKKSFKTINNYKLLNNFNL